MFWRRSFGSDVLVPRVFRAETFLRQDVLALKLFDTAVLGNTNLRRNILEPRRQNNFSAERC